MRRISTTLLLWAFLGSCGDDQPSGPPAPATGSIEVTTATTGEDLDPDGYTLTVDATDERPVGASGAVTFAGVAAGNHQIVLSEISDNCVVQGDNPRTVFVAPNSTALEAFAVSCSDREGQVRVLVQTVGTRPDPDGYVVTLDGLDRLDVDRVDPEVIFDEVVPGEHVVLLSGLEGNCFVTGDASRSVAVRAGQRTHVAYDIECAPLAYVVTGSKILVVETRNHTTIDTLALPIPSEICPPLTVSADGGLLYVRSWDASVTHVISTADHRALGEVSLVPGIFSPSGDLSYNTGYPIAIWDVASDAQVGTVGSVGGRPLAVSPDGQLLYVHDSSGDENALQLIDLTTNATLQRIDPGYDGYPASMVVTSDGYGYVAWAHSLVTVDPGSLSIVDQRGFTPYSSVQLAKSPGDDLIYVPGEDEVQIYERSPIPSYAGVLLPDDYFPGGPVTPLPSGEYVYVISGSGHLNVLAAYGIPPGPVTLVDVHTTCNRVVVMPGR